MTDLNTKPLDGMLDRLRGLALPIRRLSLRSRLSIMMIGLFGVLIWALAFLSSTVLQNRLEQVLSDQQMAATRQVARDIDDKLKDSIDGLRSVADGLPPDMSYASLQPVLAQRPLLLSKFPAGIAVIGIDGVFVADYPVVAGRRGAYVGDRDYVQQVLATGKPYIGKPIIGRTQKKPLLIIGVPVFDGAGKIRAVIVGVTDLTAPNVLGFVSDRTLTGSGQYYVFSLGDGMIIAATDSKRAMTPMPVRGRNVLFDRMVDGFEGSGVASSSEGLKKLYSGVKVPTGNWFVLSALPSEVAFGPIGDLQHILFGGAGLLTLVAFFVIRHMVGRMLSPLANAGRAMRQMTDGQAPLAPLPVLSDDEIGSLVGNFNHLVIDRQRYEAALTDSEQRFRLLVEGAPEAIVVQTKGCFTYANPAALALYGATAQEDLLGRPVLERVHPDYRGLAAHRVREVNERRRSNAAVEQIFLRCDGTPVAVEVSAVPLRFGAEDDSLVFIRDITERKRIRSEHDELIARIRSERDFSRQLINSLPGVFYVISTDARFVRWNKTFEDVTGKSAAEMAEASPLDLFGGADKDLIAHRMATVFEEGHATAEANLLIKDGDSRPYLFTGRAVELDGQRLLVGLGVDVTVIRHMEAELAQHRDHLEMLVVQRTRELALAKEQAEAAAQAKSVFLSTMSHEIRTPMNAIVGMAHLMRRGAVTPKQVDQINKIDHAAQHLLSIINDILDLSKIEAGKFVLDETDIALDSLVSNVTSILSDRVQAKGLRLVVESESLEYPLQGDSTRLTQALLNYVTNAVKFTERGSITVRCRKMETDGNSVLMRFEVEDTGIGIGAEALARLFTSFQQADSSTTREYGGTGLGLAITRHLAELMGGEAGATSVPGIGSTFWFTARLRMGLATHLESNIINPTAEAVLARDHRDKRLLLVDDEPLNLEIGVELLSETGLVIDLAANGAQAVAMAEDTCYDLILMDMQMPKVDGLDATRQIRRIPGRETVPILAMTANAFAENRQRCFDAGMNDFISKPVMPDALCATLLKWLQMDRV